MGLRRRLNGSLLGLGALFVALEAGAQGRGIVLLFDASAEGLPQAEVRAQVERELGRPVGASNDPTSDEVTVLVDQGRLVVRYRTPTGSLERYLPMPSEPDDVPLIVSLAAGNLVRSQTTGLESGSTQPEPAKPLPEPRPIVPPDREPEPFEPTFRRHRLGLHLAQDIPYVSEFDPCTLSSVEDVSCYYAEDGEAPFFHSAQPTSERIEGFSFGTTRLLFSYDYFLVPALSLGGRLGIAFGGGPPAGAAPVVAIPEGNPNLLPDHTPGTGGTSFLPLHVEARAAYWFLPTDGRWLSAYVGAGFGVAQVDSSHYLEVIDCQDTLEPSWDPGDGTFDDCTSNNPRLSDGAIDNTELDAWVKMGRGFVTATTGAALSLNNELSVVVNVNAMLMFPAVGFVLEPSLGVVLSL